MLQHLWIDELSLFCRQREDDEDRRRTEQQASRVREHIQEYRCVKPASTCYPAPSGADEGSSAEATKSGKRIIRKLF